MQDAKGKIPYRYKKTCHMIYLVQNYINLSNTENLLI